MLTKLCTKCGVEKELVCFAKSIKGKYGVRSNCKECVVEYVLSNKEAIDSRNKQWYQDNKTIISNKRQLDKENIAIKKKQYYENNKSFVTSQVKKYRQQNKTTITVKTQLYYQENKDKFCARSAHRRASKLQATPSWADQETIDSLYQLATIFNRTGINLHVDHIVPLNSNKVCGLHCESNLQLLSSHDNISKGNRHWPDQW